MERGSVLELALKKTTLKKVSNTHGGEWQGPCPGCGGPIASTSGPSGRKGAARGKG